MNSLFIPIFIIEGIAFAVIVYKLIKDRIGY